MISIEQMALVLEALPDPAFVLSRSGKYLAVFGGHDARYYHSSEGLVGLSITDIVAHDKACWFLEQIELALETNELLIREYELSIQEVNSDIKEGPSHSIWFEGRIQKLNFVVDDEPVVLWMASNITERHDMEAKLRELSDTDQLTGLFNRRRLERDLTIHYRTFVESNNPTSILVFDLDNLKIINDTLGHFVGDEVIMAVGHICRGSLNNDGIACRFGGDEFVIALPNIELSQAMVFAELLHGRFEAHFNRFFAKSLASVISVSIGVTELIPSDTSYEAALKRADDALYQAKRAGKNRTMIG